ncbi:MAG: hypothetical protein ACKOUM_08030, partial [Sphingopyxis sp.]
LAQARGVPLLTVSGATGKGLDQLIGAGFALREQWSRRVSTGSLNRWFERATEANPPPAPGGKRVKLRYITQARIRPPSFVIFGTRVDMLPESYRRYLVNGMRRELDFGAVPVRLTLRAPKNPFGDPTRKAGKYSPRNAAATRGAGGGAAPSTIRRAISDAGEPADDTGPSPAPRRAAKPQRSAGKASARPVQSKGAPQKKATKAVAKRGPAKPAPARRGASRTSPTRSGPTRTGPTRAGPAKPSGNGKRR